MELMWWRPLRALQWGQAPPPHQFLTLLLILHWRRYSGATRYATALLENGDVAPVNRIAALANDHVAPASDIAALANDHVALSKQVAAPGDQHVVLSKQIAAHR